MRPPGHFRGGFSDSGGIVDANQITAKVSGFISWALGDPLGFLLWLAKAYVVIALATIVLAPFAPGLIRPHGDVTKLIYIAGIVWLLRG